MDIFLGKRLNELRTENELTQKQVAEALGINTVTYLHHEKAQREPPLSLLADMAKYFGVSVDCFWDLPITDSKSGARRGHTVRAARLFLPP